MTMTEGCYLMRSRWNTLDWGPSAADEPSWRTDDALSRFTEVEYEELCSIFRHNLAYLSKNVGGYDLFPIV